MMEWLVVIALVFLGVLIYSVVDAGREKTYLKMEKNYQ